MADLARLGILVDSTQAATATGRLNALTASAGRAEGANAGLLGSSKRLALGLGAAGLAGAAVVLAGAFKKSISLGREFSSQLSEVEAITGIAGDALDDLSEQALDASAETGRAASEIVEAYKLVASQLAEKIDFETAAGQRVLRQVAEDATTLSIAAGIDLKTAVEGTTTAINQFNLKAEDASEVVNLLAAGSKFGAAEVADIQEALTDAGIAASVAGEDLNTTIAAIEVLGANAIKGGRAGTALKNVFIRLQTETKKLAELGIKDVNIQSDGLVETLRKLNPIADDAAALTDVFGQRAFSAAGLLIKYVDSLEDLTEKQKDTQTATEQAAVQLDNLDGDIAKLSQTINQDLIESFENGESTFREVVQELTMIWETFGDDFISVLDVIVSTTASSLKTWREVFTGEFEEGLDLANDSIFESAKKLDNRLTSYILNAGGAFINAFSDGVKQYAADLSDTVNSAVRAIQGPQDQAGTLGVPFSNEYIESLTTVDDVGKRVNETYGIMATKEQLARRELEKLNQEAEETEGVAKNIVDIGRALEGVQGVQLADGELLGGIDRQFAQFERLGELFDGYDVGRAKARLLRTEIEELVTSGETHSATLTELILKYETLTGKGIKGVKGIKDETEQTKDSIRDLDGVTQDLGFTFSSAFEDAVISGNSLRDVLNGILEDITRIILRTQVTKPLAEGLSGVLGNAFGGTSASASQPQAPKNVGDALITDKGKLYNFHPDDNILAFQGSPSKKIPGDGGGNTVTVNVINKNGSKVETTQRSTADGGLEIGVLIDERVKDSLNSGRFDRDFQSNFNLNRRGY